MGLLALGLQKESVNSQHMDIDKNSSLWAERKWAQAEWGTNEIEHFTLEQGIYC